MDGTKITIFLLSTNKLITIFLLILPLTQIIINAYSQDWGQTVFPDTISGRQPKTPSSGLVCDVPVNVFCPVDGTRINPDFIQPWSHTADPCVVTAVLIFLILSQMPAAVTHMDGVSIVYPCEIRLWRQNVLGIHIDLCNHMD